MSQQVVMRHCQGAVRSTSLGHGATLGDGQMFTAQRSIAQQLNDARTCLKSRLNKNQNLMRSAALAGDIQDSAWTWGTPERCASNKRRLLCDVDGVRDY